MSWRKSSQIQAISAVSVVILAAAQLATAQSADVHCDGPKRAPTAAEAKAYADGFAMFQRVAPKAPAGWTATDSRTEPVVTFICESALYNFTTWSFSRTFNRSQAEMQARGDAALKKTEAVRARAEARNKSKEAKIADLDRRQADLAKRVEAAATAQNFAALAAISEESNKLAAEREALMTDSAAETEMTAIDSEVTRDQTAQFTLTYGATEVATSDAYKRMPSAVGKGYRQDYQESNGNPHTDLVVVLPPIAGAPGQPVVRINGDPARADALLKETKLR
ncbi:MAG TPA: hypothetical protein VHR84_08620 [Terriglobales bacterium]|jgi:hypothetical protein|nr:hypothetical protein [Terriglobales bacterium]